MGTHPVELPLQRASKEEAASSNLALEEEATRVIEIIDTDEDSDEDFGVFDQSFPTEFLLATFSHLPFAQVSNIQELASILEATMLQLKQKTSFLELLESHVGGTTPKVAV